jgi:protein-S-isoprenylcysteine O-methyltransferase Ste14
MIERVIKCLIFSVVVVVVVGVVFWVAHFMGFPMPLIVERGVWVIAVLCILLYWWRAFGSGINIDPRPGP